MSTINGKPFSTPNNINLKKGILLFGATQASNPISSTHYGLYVNPSGQIVYSAAGVTTILGGAGGSYAAPSLDQIFQGDQTLDLTSLSTLTIDRSSGNNDILTLTNTGAGSGDLLQFNNAGTGNDVEGTSDTWHFTKAGDMTANMAVFAGDAGSDSITLTAGDVVFSDGSVAITDADNAATFTVTNNTATSASVIVLAGSGVFTGNTTSSFATLTASGLTTGTVLYIPVVGLTTGKAIDIVGTTALTTGILVNVESGTTGTSLTGAGRMLKINHTGATTSSGILAEVLSAATDETTLFQITTSQALALGTALKLSTASVTTGTLISVLGAALTTGSAISCTDLAALTTGTAINIAHATSVITTGSLVKIATSGVNTGSGGDGTALDITASGQLAGSLVTVDTIQTTGTAMSIISTGIMTTTGNLLTLTANSATTAAGLLRVNGNGLTSGIGAVITSSATAITGAGRMLRVDHTGTTTTSGVLSEFASAATDETVVLRVTASAALATGVLVDLSAAALTTGTVLDLGGLAAITTGNAVVIAASGTTRTDGMLLSISDASTAATATGRMLLVNHTGVTGVSTILSEFASAANDETIIMQITASAANALGKALLVSTATTTGNGIQVTANALTTGYALSVDSSATAITSAGRLFLINHSGVTSTSGVLTEIKSAANDETVIFQVLGSAALAAGKVVNLSAAAMTTGKVLSIEGLDALTTGTGIIVESDSAETDTRVLVQITNDNTAATGTTCLSLHNDATAGAAMAITGTGILGIDFSALGVADSLFKVTLTTDTTMKAPQTVAADGFIKVMVGAVAHYIPCYTVA
jgi:hypothetical protein